MYTPNPHQTSNRSEIGIEPKTEAYIQLLVLKKTLESISFERRRGLEEEDGHNEINELVSKIAVAKVEPVDTP